MIVSTMQRHPLQSGRPRLFGNPVQDRLVDNRELNISLPRAHGFGKLVGPPNVQIRSGQQFVERARQFHSAVVRE